MGIRKHRGAIEAILFASGDPISAQRLADVLDLDVDTVCRLIQNLADEMEDRGSGITIVKLGDNYQMTTHMDFAQEVRKALDLRRNVPLSQAALEVLAVIAYNQPVTKSFIEQVRGVDCGGVISSLLEKGLIEEAGRLELPGRPISYQTTSVFLRCFGLDSLDKLPTLPTTAGQVNGPDNQALEEIQDNGQQLSDQQPQQQPERELVSAG